MQVQHWLQSLSYMFLHFFLFQPVSLQLLHIMLCMQGRSSHTRRAIDRGRIRILTHEVSLIYLVASCSFLAHLDLYDSFIQGIQHLHDASSVVEHMLVPMLIQLQHLSHL